MTSRPRVVVIAGSIESIDALARFIRQMPAAFPIPVVAYLHGLQSRSIERLIDKKWRFASHPHIVYAREGNHLQAGHVYVLPVEDGLVFVGVDVLGVAPGDAGSNADRLFASVASVWGENTWNVLSLAFFGAQRITRCCAIKSRTGSKPVTLPSTFQGYASAVHTPAVQAGRAAHGNKRSAVPYTHRIQDTGGECSVEKNALSGESVLRQTFKTSVLTDLMDKQLR